MLIVSLISRPCNICKRDWLVDIETTRETYQRYANGLPARELLVFLKTCTCLREWMARIFSVFPLITKTSMNIPSTQTSDSCDQWNKWFLAHQEPVNRAERHGMWPCRELQRNVFLHTPSLICTFASTQSSQPSSKVYPQPPHRSFDTSLNVRGSDDDNL